VYALNYAGNAAATSQLHELSPAEKLWDFMGFDR
jgi:hypothetical protein